MLGAISHSLETLGASALKPCEIKRALCPSDQSLISPWPAHFLRNWPPTNHRDRPEQLSPTHAPFRYSATALLSHLGWLCPCGHPCCMKGINKQKTCFSRKAHLAWQCQGAKLSKPATHRKARVRMMVHLLGARINKKAELIGMAVPCLRSS